MRLLKKKKSISNEGEEKENMSYLNNGTDFVI